MLRHSRHLVHQASRFTGPRPEAFYDKGLYLRAHQAGSARGRVDGKATVDDATICTMPIAFTHGGESHVQRQVRQRMERLCRTWLLYQLWAKTLLQDRAHNLLHVMIAPCVLPFQSSQSP
jgi:hypothetical protein